MTIQQFNPPHVGALINRVYIKPYDKASGSMIAKQLGISPSTFNRLLNGKTSLKPQMAVKLSLVLGGSAESWMRLQESYDLWKVRQYIDTKAFNKIDFAKLSEV
jgi:addiction module HigA family antidote